MARTFYRLAAALAASGGLAAAGVRADQPAGPARAGAARTVTVEVAAAPGLIPAAVDGRLFVVFGKNASPEPRTTIGRTGMDAAPVAAIDVNGYDGRRAAVIDDRAAAFPVARLSDVPAGDYVAQAVLDTNIDVRSVSAPGNLYSPPTPVRIDAAGAAVKLQLSSRVPDEQLPEATAFLKWIKIPSKLLSDFHRRPIYLRAGIILPRGYDQEPRRRYPLRVHIGGYGSSYTGVLRMMRDGGPFRTAWLGEDTPRMILLHLDGDGPLGDPYQVNSANHGPYGDAIVRELIPHVEREFRTVAEPRTRVLDGGSTGGWVSLALQIFYPDVFNGAWSSCPDGVDFRGFQLINIYADDNAYVNAHGFERPSARDVNGDVRFTMRHEAQIENVLGRGDSWTMSGGQWGAWNAAYGPRAADGRPAPLWDPKTGAIDRSVTDHWKAYDLRLLLEQRWPELAPKLIGKIHVAMGDADNYFLNNAARMLETFFQKAVPPYEGRMIFAPGQGHCYTGMSELELMKAMGVRTGARP